MTQTHDRRPALPRASIPAFGIPTPSRKAPAPAISLKTLPDTSHVVLSVGDLNRLNFGALAEDTLEEAKAAFYGPRTDEERMEMADREGMFYGRGRTGAERLAPTIKTIRFDGPDSTIVTVDETWTLDRLWRVCRLAFDLQTHEMCGDSAGIDKAIAGLKEHGLTQVKVTPREELRAVFIANGGEPDDTKLWSYAHFCDRNWWDATRFIFDEATGALHPIMARVG